MYKRKLFLFGFISAAVLFVALSGVAVSAYITKENLRQSATAQSLLSEHQMLSSISYRLFKQLTDELIFGRNANQAEVRNKQALIEQSLMVIRDLEVRQRNELGPDITQGSVEDTDELQFLIAEIIDEFNAVIAMNDTTPLSQQERVQRLLEFTIDNKFREAINAAVSRQSKVVSATNARIEALNSAIVWFSIILCVLVGPFIVFGCVWLFNQLYQPLTVIGSGTQVIASGNYNFRLPENLDQEFHSLVQSLNQLAGQMAEHEKQAETMRDQLQYEVDQRTSELTEANRQLTLIDTRRKQFIADISHELRTPLTIIRGEAQVTLRQNHADTRDYRAALQTVLDQVVGLSVLVDDLLLLARAEINQLRLFPDDLQVVDILEHQVEQWQRKMPLRSFRLNTADAEKSRIVIRADEQRLRQVMTILIDNATRYSDPGDPVEISLKATEDQVMISVRDHGDGISPADLQYIFERFVRFKPRTDGAGLGLSIARTLVEAHQGEIYAESEQGQGSVFTVVLPRQAAE
ncbi:MAG: HAMP domain-containing sensor histidine kinase [Pseudomonadota bacterium]|jgi:signal transduction histidine kinase|uniref:HAMP domain-containing sensor histidine kinase n=1 Tax=unclassified Thalassolituus TaxID=2624967 RepID=UPI0023B717EB|nr:MULTISPECIES: HAMP domain-containing sensor histidine kinase [unclassified Thalassolituus]MDQ4422656.1 HAMP domain-containing sensor histidine kinase [Thalassolituus sp.]MDQ4426969.1 HAMP domain-containing sensor histidine kinase [Thalassolituus sp.]MEE3210195.1 HAMP domain-containing sensor histidine kinase [Pseudomonadota bacterium]|tara:strand:+ start:4659 stop:6221 length:1563 start_codon:yes stop_codon:yes gene_type:complete